MHIQYDPAILMRRLVSIMWVERRLVSISRGE